MAMQWMTPREPGSPWVSKSSDGRYVIAQPVMGSYGAYHVEALWARPQQLGEAPELTLAQEICEQHRARPAPSNHPKG